MNAGRPRPRRRLEREVHQCLPEDDGLRSASRARRATESRPRRRPSRRCSKRRPLVVELGEVAGEGRILERPDPSSLASRRRAVGVGRSSVAADTRAAAGGGRRGSPGSGSAGAPGTGAGSLPPRPRLGALVVVAWAGAAGQSLADLDRHSRLRQRRSAPGTAVSAAAGAGVSRGAATDVDELAGCRGRGPGRAAVSRDARGVVARRGSPKSDASAGRTAPSGSTPARPTPVTATARASPARWVSRGSPSRFGTSTSAGTRSATSGSRTGRAVCSRSRTLPTTRRSSSP